MKKILLLLISLCLLIGITGCGIVRKAEINNSEVTLSPEEKYEKALSSVRDNSYSYKFVEERSDGNYSSIEEKEYVKDIKNKYITMKMISTKSKENAGGSYVDGMTSNKLTYLDFNKNRVITYNHYGSSWNYYDMNIGTDKSVNTNEVKILLMTLEHTPTINESVYSYVINQNKIEEVIGSVYPTIDGNVRIDVSLNDDNISSFVISYAMGKANFIVKQTVIFSDSTSSVDVPSEVMNASKM